MGNSRYETEEKDMFGDTPLGRAARDGTIEYVQKLLKQGNSDPNHKNNAGFTPLILAAKFGSAECVRLLLEQTGEAKVAVNETDTEENTALMWAASNGHVECVRELLKHKDIIFDKKNKKGQTASDLATSNGHSKCVHELEEYQKEARYLANARDVISKLYLPEKLPGVPGEMDRPPIELLVEFEREIYPGAKDFISSLPYLAARYPDEHLYERLVLTLSTYQAMNISDLAMGLVVDVSKFTALQDGVREKSKKMLGGLSGLKEPDIKQMVLNYIMGMDEDLAIQWLNRIKTEKHFQHFFISRENILGIDTGDVVWDPQKATSWAFYIEAHLKALIAQKSIRVANKRDEHGNTPLMRAARTGDITLLNQELLKNNEYLHEWNMKEAIKLAAEGNHLECIKALLVNYEKKIDPESLNTPSTPLRIAAKFGYATCLKVLLRDKDTEGHGDVLLLAAEHGHEACVELLLADENLISPLNKGMALVRAAENGHVSCIRLLLQENGINPNEKDYVDSKYMTALMAAAKGGHETCVKLLCAHPGVTLGFELMGKTALDYANERSAKEKEAEKERNAKEKEAAEEEKAAEKKGDKIKAAEKKSEKEMYARMDVIGKGGINCENILVMELFIRSLNPLLEQFNDLSRPPPDASRLRMLLAQRAFPGNKNIIDWLVAYRGEERKDHLHARVLLGIIMMLEGMSDKRDREPLLFYRDQLLQEMPEPGIKERVFNYICGLKNKDHVTAWLERANLPGHQLGQFFRFDAGIVGKMTRFAGGFFTPVDTSWAKKIETKLHELKNPKIVEPQATMHDQL